jgi:hypothetical protein
MKKSDIAAAPATPSVQVIGRIFNCSKSWLTAKKR